MSGYGSGVSPADVRTSLGEIDQDYLPEDTIQQAIDFAEIEVKSKLDSAGVDSVSQERRHMAVIAVARRIAFMSIPAEDRIQAVDATVSYDIESFIEELRNREEAALGTIVSSNRPSFRSARSR